MSYLVKINTGYSNEAAIGPNGESVYWQSGQVRIVPDEFIAYYQRHSDVFTVIANSAAMAAFVQSADSSTGKKIYNYTHTVTSDEETAGLVEIELPFTPTTWNVQVFSATGAPIYITDLITLEENDVFTITADGATSLAEGNVVHLICVG